MTLRRNGPFAIQEHPYLHSLTVHGDFNSGKDLSLSMNHHIHLAKGNQDYILDFREEVLINHTYFKYNVPEDFELDWNFKIGPISNPTNLPSLTSSHEVAFWLKTEGFEQETDGTNYINFVDSQGNFDFTQATEANRPAVAAKGLNNYQAASFDGTDDIIYATNPATSKLDIAAGKDFLVAFVLNLADTDSTDTLMQIGANVTNGYMLLSTLSSADTDDVRIITRTGGSNSVLRFNDVIQSFDSNAILIVGEVNGNFIARWNGTETVKTGARQAIEGGTTNITIGAGYTSSADQDHSNVDIYESCFIIERPVSAGGLSTAICEELEGYFAHKFKLTESLPDSHAYKNNPPRTSVVNPNP